MPQPGGERLLQPLLRRGGGAAQRAEHLGAQRVEQAGVAVDDDRVEVLVGEDGVGRQHAGLLQARGDLGDVDAGREPVRRDRHPDHGVRAAQRALQPLAQAGPGGVGDDRAISGGRLNTRCEGSMRASTACAVGFSGSASTTAAVSGSGHPARRAAASTAPASARSESSSPTSSSRSRSRVAAASDCSIT
ncbi:hypothetical protein BJF78_10605 [Pseudonocardia sp. CNS-139]|nr:hypothetical protein BJF78_10605 [Pseudonocardia sp. CNS-139]